MKQSPVYTYGDTWIENSQPVPVALFLLLCWYFTCLLLHRRVDLLENFTITSHYELPVETMLRKTNHFSISSYKSGLSKVFDHVCNIAMVARGDRGYYIQWLLETLTIAVSWKIGILIQKWTHTAPKYLENIVKIFLGNIVRLPKYFETYH